MKKIIISLFVLTGIAIPSFGQQETMEQITARKLRQERKADTALAERTVKTMKHLFTLSADKEKEVYQTALQNNHERRGIFKQYWGTPLFRINMKQADHKADSLMRIVIGNNNMDLYKRTIHNAAERKQEAIRSGKQRPDTLQKQ